MLKVIKLGESLVNARNNFTNFARMVSKCDNTSTISHNSNTWRTIHAQSGSDSQSMSPSSSTSPRSSESWQQSSAVEDRPQFPGSRSQWTEELKFVEPNSYEGIPVYRVMNREGRVVNEFAFEHLIHFDQQFVSKLYRNMVKLDVMDTILYDAQRQGRISFYITSHGEEATHFGPAAALNDDDLVFGQYREPGVLIWRGFTYDQFLDQCFGNELDYGKGRQMPIHYGSKELNFVTIKSTLTSQMLHAVGAAYAFKRQSKQRIVLCYFGDGAASEGDAHAALNFAATLDCPVIFFCRNNGFAISTPTCEQYRGDGIAARGPALGIPTIRIDGNDVLAAYNSTLAARKICAEECRPVLIEAMTYRVGHHSTSDDSSVYRSVDEVRSWKQRDHPIVRLRSFMKYKGWWNEEEENKFRDDQRKEIMTAIVRAERVLKPSVKYLFTDVYEEFPQHLKEQYEELMSHVSQYKQYYPKNFKQK